MTILYVGIDLAKIRVAVKSRVTPIRKEIVGWKVSQAVNDSAVVFAVENVGDGNAKHFGQDVLRLFATDAQLRNRDGRDVDDVCCFTPNERSLDDRSANDLSHVHSPVVKDEGLTLR